MSLSPTSSKCRIISVCNVCLPPTLTLDLAHFLSSFWLRVLIPVLSSTKRFGRRSIELECKSIDNSSIIIFLPISFLRVKKEKRKEKHAKKQTHSIPSRYFLLFSRTLVRHLILLQFPLLKLTVIQLSSSLLDINCTAYGLHDSC